MPNYWYDHVHLTGKAPLETAQFYEKYFDAKRVAITTLPDGRTSVALDLNGSRLLVVERKAQAEVASSGGGLDHFGIRTDDLETAVAKLKEGGVQFRDEIRQANPTLKIAFFWGPDNVLVELLERSD